MLLWLAPPLLPSWWRFFATRYSHHSRRVLGFVAAAKVSPLVQMMMQQLSEPRIARNTAPSGA